MALPEGNTPTGKAFWTDLETRELVTFLYDNRSRGDGAGNFRPDTYNAAAAYLAPHLSQGSPKTGTMCKGKWTSVCSNVFSIISLTFYVA